MRKKCPNGLPRSAGCCPGDNTMECPEGSDELGCPKPPTCHPVMVPGQNGDMTCSNECPLVCAYNQQRCEIRANSDPNCPDKKTYSCISDNSDPLA